MTDQPMAAYCGKLEAEIERLRVALKEIAGSPIILTAHEMARLARSTLKQELAGMTIKDMWYLTIIVVAWLVIYANWFH